MAKTKSNTNNTVPVAPSDRKMKGPKGSESKSELGIKITVANNS